ncbi:LpqB family beta-propeller domain-containing protein [Streptomyces sp. H10-C2]|uniref:LpqB family beta-propeller domain-containing protein n=1 Tax=unclassified Streptomyces TaxID=2593676 RepID=UPI0024B892D6|nr:MULTISPECIES: LpqB family beta-propeller domain-containing protein [unclassified Streptomyces]MDJ0345735.1 LpqB family beta-propeller domain-containing protein [Streptomyces sp. PH10-H1]MDJ0374572.1 LpqB family beta-propeller domain-containing protein [Streptomyces sp. H10-C2]
MRAMGELRDRRSTRDRRGMRPARLWPAVAVGCALLLAGCASMPGSGEVHKVGGEQSADSDQQVQVLGIKPHSGEFPEEIVRGFLEATTSDEAEYATAKEYLTTGMAKRWDPFAKITVLSGAPSPIDESVGNARKEGFRSFGLTGSQVAGVDDKHAYSPGEGTSFHTSFQLVKENNEWRIDSVDNGLVLTESDFQRIYHSVNMYYFASLGTSGAGPATLVADPVYLRRRINSLESAVSAMLGGPTDWLAPVVTSDAPKGVALYSKDADNGVSLDDSQHLRVRLNAMADRMGATQCRRLAAQLLPTAQSQSATKITSVELQRANGDSACTLSDEQARPFAPETLSGSAPQQFFIDDQQQLVSLPDDSSSLAEPVPGVLGGSKANLVSVAVKRDGQFAAGVRTGGHELIVANITKGSADPGRAALTSTAHAPKDGLSAPSWDGYGNLWVADRDGARSRLLMLRNGTNEQHEVAVPDLGDARIESLRVAPDGVRIAMLVKKDGRTQLKFGRIQRSGTPEAPVISVAGLKGVTPQLEDVTAASWAGGSRLLVVGTESGGLQQIQYMNTDGSVPATPGLPGISDAASVAASEDQTKPLLAAYKGGIYRLLAQDANWKQIAAKGTGPVYPG